MEAWEEAGQTERVRKENVAWMRGLAEGQQLLLLKTMDKNINKYISLVTEMNNLVKDLKEKCFWNPEIMRMCKRWDDAVKNTVPTRTDQVSSGGEEAIQNKVGEGGDTIEELGGDGDATVEHKNTGKTKGCHDVDNMTYDDGGISDSCLAALQTIEPGVYKQTPEVTQADVVHQMDQAVNLAECSQQKAQSGKEMPPTTSAEEPDEVTDAEMQSVETLLKLAPILQTPNEREPNTTVSANTKKTDDEIHKQLTDDERHTQLVRTRLKMLKEKNEKRMAELGEAYRSPYCNRITNLYELLLDRDQTIICYLLAPVEDIGTFIYKSESGFEALKIIFESFHPSQYIASSGVDAFVDVLNFEEKKRDKKSSPYRLFLPSTIFQDEMFGPKYSDNDRLKVFAPIVDDILSKYQVKKVDTLDLIFIPVLLSDHFWCLCFHLKKGEIELIDNSRFDEPFSKRCRGRPEKLQRVLGLYLKGKIRQQEWITNLERASIIRKEMDWRTLQNGCDCGVFTMRHMETYKGKSPWNPGFENGDKKKRQDSQLRFLRYRYFSKIVLSDYNLIRKEVFEKAKEFTKKASTVDILRDLDNKIKDRLDQFFSLKKGEKMLSR
ncbi:putative papain-like cysteine peptidase superfamily [Helianthus annuus]|nr:putative papain-like cysteine peptidase superfamily [Helianthus annuus]